MSNNFRIEEDLLGKREVPDDVYYGVHTLRAIENFYISDRTINDVPEFIRGMVMVKKAAAMANKELHTIPRAIADTIIKACDEVLIHGKCMDQFPVDVFPGGCRYVTEHEYKRSTGQYRPGTDGPQKRGI